MTTKVRLIKRYQNRKLYDVEQSKYITLSDIAALVKDNVLFQVIENKTDKDLTNATLKQAVFQNKDFTNEELTQWLKL